MVCQPAHRYPRRRHPVSEEDAFEYAHRAARTEGIFVGQSAGASFAAVTNKLPDLPDGSRVLTYCYDTGERYLSVEGLYDDGERSLGQHQLRLR